MQIKKTLNKALITVIVLLTVLAGNALSAKANFNIAVFYPDVRKPYDTFFNSINAGIKDNKQGQITLKSISKNEHADAISSWLNENKPDAIILLGSSFKRFSEEFDGPYKVIYGASFFSNNQIENGQSGVSITPKPAILFNKLKTFIPELTQIDVVYHLPTNGWLIDKAANSAKELGITLVKHPVDSIKQAALTYRELSAKEQNLTKALWLLQHDPTLDERTLLPKILADAWEHRQIVFSSNPRHVKRGALFSLLPDNDLLGKDLAQKAIDVINGRHSAVDSMRSSLIIANTRTAKHLTLSDDNFREDNFTMIYPRKK